MFTLNKKNLPSAVSKAAEEGFSLSNTRLYAAPYNEEQPCLPFP
jgi:hypothetical protein